MLISNNTIPECVMISIYSEDMEAMPKPIRDFYSCMKEWFLDEDIYLTFYPYCTMPDKHPVFFS